MTDGSTRTKSHSDEAGAQSPTTVESRSFRRSDGYKTKTALFRVRSAHAILQHVRTTIVSQRAASRCEIDTDVTLDDVPDYVLTELRTMGCDIAAGGDV